MKIFSNNSRFSYGILLVILIISITGTFFALHNQLIQFSSKAPLIAVFLVIISIVIAIILFQRLTAAISAASKSTHQLEQLKKSMQQSKREAENEAELEGKDEETIEINYEAEALSFIPDENFEDEEKFMEKLLSNISTKLDIVQAIAFQKDLKTQTFSFLAGYAYFSESDPPTFTEGDTLPGQVAKNKSILNLSDIPENYITVLSGLGKGAPKHLLIIPIFNQEKDCIAVIELASFKEFDDQKVKLLEACSSIFGEHLLKIGDSTNDNV